MVALKKNNYKLITAKAFAPNLGAEIYGVDLSEPVPEDQFNEIKQAFLDYQVLFFNCWLGFLFAINEFFNFTPVFINQFTIKF